MRVFIFGIGGTGSRVLRSLTMLLASGVKINQPSLTVVPIVIDTDAHNGDTARTRDLLRNYYATRKTFVNKTANSTTGCFFNTEIRSFNRLDEKAPDSADLDVQFNFQNQDNTFANFINYNALSQENKDLMELFYNDSVNHFPELHLNLSVGFKGNPNIGSVVFNDLKYSQQFKNLESSFTATDRIFIISSIFGGTGSSGFPTLVKLIRTSSNNNMANTKIGAITVMPYFNVEANENSAINSAIFDTKTKAALSFYSGDSHISSINALYYIADNNQPGSLPNVEGGVDQVNNAHLIEMLSATAIVDFLNTDDTVLEAPRCMEFGAEADGSPFTIAQLSNDTKEKYIKPLAIFAYATKIGIDFIPKLKDETFYGPKELNIGNFLGMKGEYDKLIAFFKAFQAWSTSEMGSINNGRAFNSFNFDGIDNVNTLVHGKSIKTTFFDNGLSKKKIAAQLTPNLLSLAADITKPEKYLTMLYKTADFCLKQFGQLP
jgi:Tubulin like